MDHVANLDGYPIKAPDDEAFKGVPPAVPLRSLLTSWVLRSMEDQMPHKQEIFADLKRSWQRAVAVIRSQVSASVSNHVERRSQQLEAIVKIQVEQQCQNSSIAKWHNRHKVWKSGKMIIFQYLNLQKFSFTKIQFYQNSILQKSNVATIQY